MRIAETLEHEEFICCPDCKALLAYTENDIQENINCDWIGGWQLGHLEGNIEKCIYCPNCGERITISRSEVSYSLETVD